MSLALPDVFLPYQKRFMAAVDAHAVVVEEKSRRTGFSWAAAAVAALKAASTRSAGGSDVFYMGYNLEMAREFIDYVAEWARAVEPAAAEVHDFVFTDPDNPEKQIKAFRVEFASGFKVLALPSVPRALRGMQGFVIIDEAAFHDDLEELLKAAFALLIWGGKVAIISTHNGDTNPFNVLVQDIRAGRRPYYLGRTTFDDALADGLYRRICLTTGKPWSPEAEGAWRAEIIAFYGDDADEELHVIPQPSSGAYLPAPLIEARSLASIPVLRFDAPAGMAEWKGHLREAEMRDWCERELGPVLAGLPEDEPSALGEDFGRIRDLTVLWVLGIARNLVRHTRVVIELRGVPFEQQRQILFYLLDRLPRLRSAIMDAGGNGAYLAEVAMQRYGARIQPLQLSEPWYREGMPPFKAALEDAMMTLPLDRDIHGDLRGLKLVRGVARIPERRRTDEGATRHGDAAIAAALAYAASRAEPEEYDYHGGAPREDGVTSSGWSNQPRDEEDDNRPPGRSIMPALRSFRP